MFDFDHNFWSIFFKRPFSAISTYISGMTIDIKNYVSGYKCHVPVSKMLLFLSYLMKCCHFSHFWGYKWRRRRFVYQCSPSRPGTQLNTRHKCYRTHLVSIWGIFVWDPAFVSRHIWIFHLAEISSEISKRYLICIKTHIQKLPFSPL